MSILKKNLSRQSKNQKRRLPNKRADEKQSKLFIEKAREIGADEEQSAGDELLGQLAKMAPEPRAAKKRKPSRRAAS
jgi:hypothetical protein